MRIAWLVVLLMPVLFVTEEMAARLGAVTGAGHARLITERFGRRWGAFALADLLVLNLLTLVTEFIGVSMSLGYFGVRSGVPVRMEAPGSVGVGCHRLTSSRQPAGSAGNSYVSSFI